MRRTQERNQRHEQRHEHETTRKGHSADESFLLSLSSLFFFLSFFLALPPLGSRVDVRSGLRLTCRSNFPFPRQIYFHGMREVLFVKIEVDVANFRVRGNKLPGTQVSDFPRAGRR